MFRLPLRPSPFGFALGFAVVALWALLWIWFLAQLLAGPQRTARRPGEIPALTRQVEASARPGRAG